MVVTASGIVSDVRPEHPSKASAAISVSVEGRDTLLIVVTPEKSLYGIVSTPSETDKVIPGSAEPMPLNALLPTVVHSVAPYTNPVRPVHP